MARFRKNAQGNYSQNAKDTALAIYMDEGASVAAKETGISADTIRRWASRAGVSEDRAKSTQKATEQAAQDAALKREQIKVDCRNRAVDLIQRMSEEHTMFVGKDGRRVQIDRADASACREYAVAVGILIDKAELLDGRATSREEHRNVDQLDREIESLLAGADASRQPA